MNKKFVKLALILIATFTVFISCGQSDGGDEKEVLLNFDNKSWCVRDSHFCDKEQYVYKVNVGDEIFFIDVNGSYITEGKCVDYVKIGTRNVKPYTKIVVRAEDAIDGIIPITTVNKTSEKITINYDADKFNNVSVVNTMWVSDSISNSGTVDEGRYVEFCPKLSEGKVVDKWKINGKVYENECNRLKCFYAQSHKLSFVAGYFGTTVNVSYTTRDENTYTVSFPETVKLICDSEELTSNTNVKEGKELFFELKDNALASTEILTGWLINGLKYSSVYPDIEFYANSFTSKNNKITVEPVTRAKKTLKLGMAKGIKSFIYDSSSSDYIEYTDNTVLEGASLRFTCTIPEGKAIDYLIINDVVSFTPLPGENTIDIHWRYYEDYIINDTIYVKVVFKDE